MQADIYVCIYALYMYECMYVCMEMDVGYIFPCPPLPLLGPESFYQPKYLCICEHNSEGNGDGCGADLSQTTTTS